jgi:hypothetical protein
MNVQSIVEFENDVSEQNVKRKKSKKAVPLTQQISSKV